VADVMQQDGHGQCLFFLRSYLHALAPQGGNAFRYQVQRTQGMVKPGVQCAGIDHERQAQLTDAGQALKPRVFDQSQQQGVGHADEAVNGVIEYFFSWRHNEFRIRKLICTFMRMAYQAAGCLDFISLTR